jgi:peptidoglycan/xylan/chitin deacetylase (PgdA/CDA1 family)
MDDVANVGFVQVAKQPAQGLRIARFDCLPDALDGLLAQSALLVAQVEARRRGFGNVVFFTHAAPRLDHWRMFLTANRHPLRLNMRWIGRQVECFYACAWHRANRSGMKLRLGESLTIALETGQSHLRAVLIMKQTFLALALSCSIVAANAEPAPCPGNADALGTGRTLAVTAATTPRVGRRQFPQALPLEPKEVVLTFDDGPWQGTTRKILEALKRECVKATFFMLGRNAEAHPELARAVREAGHVVGHHTYAHRLLDRIPIAAAEAEINHGIAAVEQALYGDSAAKPVTPFFRFPGFASRPDLLDWLEKRQLVVFGTDLWASDWLRMSHGAELRLVLARLQTAGRGIILLHDTKSQTAAMLPIFLRELKRRGYRIVHAVPATPDSALPPPL